MLPKSLWPSHRPNSIQMTGTATDYFLQTLDTLRSGEEILLYAHAVQIPSQELELAAAFLETEYDNECLGYPGQAPAFDTAAALWAAKTVYIAAQLLLYRQDKEADIPAMLPAYEGVITPGTILSADLCLRFLPDVLQMAKNIDADDVLVTILAVHLQQWHYSAIGHLIQTEGLDFSVINTNSCLQQLYADRVIARKDKRLAALAEVAPMVKAALGNHQTYFWNEL
jgi:MoxR-vWA-beta-propeller ternary system domain bpX4